MKKNSDMKKKADMKPILFSTPMVQAILDGRKTMTRRVLKTPHDFDVFWKMEHNIAIFNEEDSPLNVIVRPKYKVGDVLYVRETFGVLHYEGVDTTPTYFYKADGGEIAQIKGIWKPSLFMPKEAARIFLKVTAVKAERLQDISEEDAIAEGIQPVQDFDSGNGLSGRQMYENYLPKGYTEVLPIDSFQSLWQSINGPESWDENPWVWAYTFERCERPTQNTKLL